eukprot:gb/GEZN01014422.1/.p1 GENE.gb/GEZN01014422.1/~~gb/GEZN01014422.1/.p1  ORF type:complete len:210 (-),score=27.12 gb/GEZN01014422.1/:96-725(-)
MNYRDTNVCCKPETIPDAETINSNYGKNYRWDRCGSLSDRCQDFFIAEACFYECEPAIGLYARKFTHGWLPGDSDVLGDYNDTDNTWEIWRMPISADFCDDWYFACKDDYFCAEDGGDFFGCAAIYEKFDEQPLLTNLHVKELAAGAIVGIFFAVFCCLCVTVMFLRERQGKPVFAVLPSEDSDSQKSKKLMTASSGDVGMAESPSPSP